MRLLGMDINELHTKTVAVKNLASHGSVPNLNDIVTICNEMLGLIELLPSLEKAGKLLNLVKELHNFAHNI